MLHAAVTHLANTLPLVAAKAFDELAIGAAILLTIAGMVMHWHLPRHRMSMEEHAKDDKVTADEARRRIKFYERAALIATLLGVAVLVVVLLDLTG